MPDKILFVDDDLNILQGFQRNLRQRYTVVTAPSADHALEILKEDGSFPVIVSDFRMPSMNGVEFFSKTSAEWPDSVRVLLTGEADTRAAAAAVNQGNIFRFLTKPCPALILEKTLEEAVKQHDLITAEKVLLERTLRGSMEVLTEILNLVHPIAFSRSSRIYQVAKQILPEINVAGKWEFEIAAMLSHIGCITVPFEILDKVCSGKDLTDKERFTYNSYPDAGCRLLEKIPRLELVAKIIQSQLEAPAPIPAWQQLDTVDRLTLGANLLKLCIDVEDAIFTGLAKSSVVSSLRAKDHHEALVNAVESLDFAETDSRLVPSSQLATGMVLDGDIFGENGLLLMRSGQFLSPTMIQYLQHRLDYSDVDEPVRVKIRTAV